MGSNHRRDRGDFPAQPKHCREITDIFGMCVRVEGTDDVSTATHTRTKHSELFLLAVQRFVCKDDAELSCYLSNCWSPVIG